MTAPNAASVTPELVFRVHGTPAPQGSKRHVGRGILVESSAKVKPWREAVKHAALDAAAAAGWQAPAGPVRVTIVFVLPRPKAHYRTGRNAHLLRDDAPFYVAKKPDLDKLARSSLDAISDAGVWFDDAQVTGLDVSKVYAQDPSCVGARITVRLPAGAATKAVAS